MPRLSLRLAALPILALCAGAAPAGAQGFLRQLNEVRLQPSDYDAIAAATSELLREPDAAPGATRPWSNDETGAHGTVEIMAASTDPEGRECRDIKQVAETRATRTPVVYESRRCRQPDGSWILVE